MFLDLSVFMWKWHAKGTCNMHLHQMPRWHLTYAYICRALQAIHLESNLLIYPQSLKGDFSKPFCIVISYSLQFLNKNYWLDKNVWLVFIILRVKGCTSSCQYLELLFTLKLPNGFYVTAQRIVSNFMMFQMILRCCFYPVGLRAWDDVFRPRMGQNL